MKNIFYLATLFTLLVGCNNDDGGEQIFTPQVITPVLIAQSVSGMSFNFPNPAYIYFTNENEWEQFKADYWWQSTNYPEAIVDFNEYIPIVCLDEGRPDSGFIININSITEYENNIVVDVEILYGGGAHTPSRPFIAVKIPKTGKPIVFE